MSKPTRMAKTLEVTASACKFGKVLEADFLHFFL